jgi:hypothetical protein
MAGMAANNTKIFESSIWRWRLAAKTAGGCQRSLGGVFQLINVSNVVVGSIEISI